jgi:hypothetical protein
VAAADSEVGRRRDWKRRGRRLDGWGGRASGGGGAGGGESGRGELQRPGPVGGELGSSRMVAGQWRARGQERAREGDGEAESLGKDAERRGADAERDSDARKMARLLDRVLTGVFLFLPMQIVLASLSELL